MKFPSRAFVAFGIISGLFLPGINGKEEVVSSPDYVTAPDKILRTIERFIPSKAATLPPGMASRMGAAHVWGKYSFTDKPFLLEGCEDVLKLGFTGVKLWFTNVQQEYPFHSEWNLPKDYTLLDLAKHPYFEAAFAMPFEVFALEVQPVKARHAIVPKGFAMDPSSDFGEDENQIHALASYLLAKFHDRQVTFILQNWEGDWMLQGGAKDAWARGEYPDLDLRAKTFVRWLQARQRGVEKARAEHPGSRCKVLHAVEVNEVLATWKGMPTVTSQVLPYAKTDMVSWSCYDGMQNHKKSLQSTAVGLWQGIETIRHFARMAHEGRDVPVYIGEIGIPEQKGFKSENIRAIWDGAFATLLAMDVPYIFQWEIYDNEIKDGVVPNAAGTYAEDELVGYWLRKPDGTLSTTGEYLTSLIRRSRTR